MTQIVTFEGIQDIEPAVPPTKWRKNAPASVILFATNGAGAVCIIESQGPDAEYILSDDLTKKILIDYDLAPWKFPGLWVWEGKVVGSKDYWGEYDEEFVGDIRPLTENEARSIREDDLTWDRNLWIEETK